MKTTLRLLAFALMLLGAGASASNFYGYKAPLPNVTITAPNNLLGFKVTVTTGGALQAFGANFRAASGNGSMGLYAANGANGDPGTLLAQTGSFAIAAAGVLQLPPTAPVTLAAGDYWIMGVFSADAYPGYGFSTAEVIKYRALPFSGTLPGTFGTTATYMGGKFNYYIKVAGSIHAVLYARRGKVPGAGDAGSGIPEDAEFETFGSPAINALGDVVFRATWTSSTGPGAGLVVHNPQALGGAVAQVVAKLGGTVGGSPGGGGMVIKKLGDPIGIGDAGNVVFTATATPQSGPGALTAGGLATTVTITTLGRQSLAIVAETGTVVTGTGGGVLRRINYVAVTPDGGVLIDGTLALRRGVVTAKDDHVLVAARAVDLAGNTSSEGITTLLREGVTQIQNNGALGTPNNNEVQRIRTFEVFPPVRGGTGVFNDSEVVFRATSTGSATLLSRGDFQAQILHYR